MNPFTHDYEGTNTHLSTWDMNIENNTFYWVKEKYTIESKYQYENNNIKTILYYDENIIKKLQSQLYSQQPTVENITRTTQYLITNYLETW